jgi:hypothetical protein
MKPIAMLFNGVWSQYTFATAPKYRDFFELLYIHDLNETQLANYSALVIPFQSHLQALAEHQALLDGFLAKGGTIAAFGDSASSGFGAHWEDRPVNNHWWKETPDAPPVALTDFSHPLFAGLTPRQACWHCHGVYTKIPEGARSIQTNSNHEWVTWELLIGKGRLLASTLDPIVEHGVQQIRHLDHFCDNLTYWLCGQRPDPSSLTIDKEAYGVRYVA